MKMGVMPSSRGMGPRGTKGDTGERGPGIINWQGKWSVDRKYVVHDAVKYEGSSYLCLVENSGQQPDQNEKSWDCLALRGGDGKDGEGRKGDRGDIGPEGKSIQGDRGIQGPKGDGFSWKGQWSFSVKYKALDVVSYRGNSFVCLADHVNQTPSIGSYWDLMVQKGDSGLQGSKGDSITGDAGKDGVSVNWKGPWTGDADYLMNDAVSLRGSSYICLYRHNNQQPPNASYWGLLAGKGDTGFNGNDGVVVPGGRLSLTSQKPVNILDAKSTTVYYTPYVHDQVSLYNGESWQTVTFVETSISIPKTTTQVFDVYGFLSRGSFAIELCGWNNAVRSADVQRFQGRLTKIDDPTRLYLGSVCTNADGVAEDSESSRLLFNVYHQIPRILKSSNVAAALFGLDGAVANFGGVFDTPAPGYHEYGPLLGLINV